MKSPTPKIHLLDVHEPLVSFSELEMRCGAILENAQNEFMVSGDFDKWLKEARAAALAERG